jgi:hypothetical protein
MNAELTSDQIAAIASAVCKAMPAPAPRASATRNSWMAVAALIVAVLGLMGAGFGVWVSSSNQQAAMSVRITSLSDTVMKNGTRIDRLEQMPQPSSISPQQLQDLKDSFAEFRAQYKEDTRDLKQQVEKLQERKR